MAFALGASGLEAQVESGEGVGEDRRIDFIAFGGVLQPIADLTDDPSSFGTVIDPNLAVGGEVTYWATDAIGIGVLGFYSPATLSAKATQFQGAIPDDLGNVDYIAGMVDVTFRLRSSGSASSLEPYFAVGGGLRRLAMDAIAAPEAVTSTDPAATAGMGARVLVTSRLWLRGELRGFASLYESPTTGDTRLQNDVAVTIGFGIR